MNLNVSAPLIEAVSVILPQNECSVADELKLCGISEQRLKVLRKNLGIKRHFVAPSHTYASHLASKALQTLFDNGLDKNELDGLIIACPTPDFLAPAMSSLISKSVNLNPKTICIDTVAFCPGFNSLFFQAALMLENKSFRKVAVLCAITRSKMIPPNDKIAFLANTDAASCVLLSKGRGKDKMHFYQGLFSEFALDETKPIKCFNKDALDYAMVNADLIFSFVNKNFPEFLAKFYEMHKISQESVDKFFIQSPNIFVKQKLCESLGLCEFKTSVSFGNETLDFIKDETLENFGDASVNKIPIDLALAAKSYAENLANANVCAAKQGFKNPQSKNETAKENFKNPQNQTLKSTQKCLLASYGTGISLNALCVDIDFSKIKSIIKIVPF